ncbi:DUF1152 domain-containing protein [Catellatospora sp. KI3]|uniref:DUF1152 domain-containing protein n=1 Tax=Catellatospora sp. KI3 TaxID=3041620 RepID=UPI00248249FC|nr:DUF1152 domain-containing protein [Catellatospora sp. KI3]MDI1463180.1 DUF1152 domain-containing protein [Catellatospora sp. KI3]
MTAIFEPPLSRRLRAARHVLIAGAGGGFDVYAGLPLALALRNAGVRTTLAGYSVSELGALPPTAWLRSGLAEVRPDSPGNDRYFPERTLARWLATQGHDPVVYAFDRTGVRPLRAAYRALVERLDVDAVVLADGGTDILMRGDEAGLGTPEEDATSLIAVAGLPVPVKLVVSLGFGIDSHHGVCHAHVLENIAALDRAGAYLGAFSIPPGGPEARAYLDAVAHSVREAPRTASIVNTQVASALRGGFGDEHATGRTEGTELFVNPLMAMYFGFDLDGLARHLHYGAALERTRSRTEVALAIEEFREGLDRPRPRRLIPH